MLTSLVLKSMNRQKNKVLQSNQFGIVQNLSFLSKTVTVKHKIFYFTSHGFYILPYNLPVTILM